MNVQYSIFSNEKLIAVVPERNGVCGETNDVEQWKSQELVLVKQKTNLGR
jgi:hypothetical protein